MFKIEIKKTGKTDMEKIIQESIAEKVKEVLSNYACPKHNQGVSITVEGTSVSLSGCCEESKSRALELLN